MIAWGEKGFEWLDCGSSHRLKGSAILLAKIADFLMSHYVRNNVDKKKRVTVTEGSTPEARLILTTAFIFFKRGIIM